ncbi:NAD(P)/FAD-dependent oxidoreductase [Aliiroseovarius crassostreae]|uniref:FAD/NAD(P)-dependent oxidoreductase n=1 Tax=Aliiroseovarius crassostreae TaxID=154981 RepID=UPI003C7C5529
MTDTNLAIIGAGPAGMAAAATAAETGLTVTLLDEQKRLGGQIYRDIERVNELRAAVLGKDYMAGLTLVDGLADADISYVPDATVWQADEQGQISYSVDGAAKQITADRILIATGALERPVPIPGWTLPGVMMAGAGQILLKQSGIFAKRAVVVGAGPLLYLIAAQMVRAGTPPLAVVETQTTQNLLEAQKYLPGALSGWRYLAKGLGLIAELRRAGVKRYKAATNLAIKGKDQAQALVFDCRGKSERIDCDTVFLHMGVVPNTQLSRAMNLAHEWDTTQLCFRPVTDKWGASSSERVFIAGDGAGISGAKSAEIAGRIASLRIAKELGRIDAADFQRRSQPFQRALSKERAIRPFLDTAFPPAKDILTPQNDTIVCRCEEVTAADIRRYAAMGCDGPNQTKAFGRPGMGPCQGRYCGLTVSMLLAEANKRSPQDTGYYRIRPPIKPLTLGELAQLDENTQDERKELELG